MMYRPFSSRFVALGTQTIVHDKQRNQMVIRLQGVVVLPRRGNHRAS